MKSVIWRVSKDEKFVNGMTWSSRDVAIDIMELEMKCEIDELKRTRPDSQFTMEIDKEEGVGTIDEYYFDENYEEDCWNFDISKFEVKEFSWQK